MERVSKYMPEVLSILRLVIGLLFLEHGSSKLFGFHLSSPKCQKRLRKDFILHLSGLGRAARGQDPRFI